MFRQFEIRFINKILTLSHTVAHSQWLSFMQSNACKSRHIRESYRHIQYSHPISHKVRKNGGGLSDICKRNSSLIFINCLYGGGVVTSLFFPEIQISIFLNFHSAHRTYKAEMFHAGLLHRWKKNCGLNFKLCSGI